MSEGPAAGVEVASATSQAAGEQEPDQAAEASASKITFSGAGAKPPVAPTTKAATPSASDQAFGEPEPETGDPQTRFRAAVAKRGPAAITIAGQAASVIGPLLTKDPTLAAGYFEIVAANRADAYRTPLAALFAHLTVADKKKLFAAQYGFAIVEHQRDASGMKAGEFYADQIDKMYEAAALLPPAHMIGNPRFKKLDAGMGATFHDKQATIEMPSYQEASTGNMEKAYSSAFCHEVGHAVDFALGDKTNALRRELGWTVINERDDDANLAAHLERLGTLASGLEAQERLDLASAMGGAISGGDEYMTTHLTFFKGYDKDKAAALIARGVMPLWKQRRDAFFEDGLTLGDQHYFARGYGNGGWAYRVNQTTFDATPPKGKVSHYEWFAEWYAKYYATPQHDGVPARLNEFFRDEVEPFNQQRSPLGAPDTTEGTGGQTPRFG